jgi:O-antigen ligase
MSAIDERIHDELLLMPTSSASAIVSDLPALPRAGARPRQVAFVSLTLMVAAVQFSIAIAQIFLTLALLAWATALIIEHRRPSAPRWAIPMMLYAGWTLLSAFLSLDPRTSIIDCKQLVLFLIVPLTFEIVDEGSALPLTTIILAAGACSALVGIGQYSILHYDNLGQRPRSTLGISLTFSGLMMLVLNVAVARVLFMTKSRVWPAVVMPALAVVLALSFGRSAWVGWCCAVAILLMMRHLRLFALLPVIAAIFFATAPTQVIQRFYSIFDMHDPSNRDRIAMFRAGEQIVAAHPITGVGPNMIPRVYPRYRSPDAVMQEPPHLHNVPMQIAAERGLPALGLWIWFITAIAGGSAALFRNAPREGPLRFLAAAALAAVVSMLGAGMFEYNFGDSEFLMLFLVLITMPFAVAKRREVSERF